MKQVIPGIYQLRLPIPNNPLEYTNVYLVQGNNGHFLIDAGWNSEEALQALKEQLAEIGVAFTDIAHIIVTHMHGDHYGLTGRLKQLSGAKIALHFKESMAVHPENVDVNRLRSQNEEWLNMNGVPMGTLPSMFFFRTFGSLPAPDIDLRGDETISTGFFKLKIVWTPGHSPGHICLYEPEKKIFFCGDHVLPVITPNVSLQFHDVNPLGDFLSSLRSLKDLEVTVALPAHEHIFKNFHIRVDEIIHHHEHRSLEILDSLKAHAKTAYDISDEITWMPEFGGVRFHDLAPWDKRMAVSETLAHLEAMRIEGRLDRFVRNNTVYYNPSG